MRGHPAEGVAQNNAGKTNPQNSSHCESDDGDDERQDDNGHEDDQPMRGCQ